MLHDRSYAWVFTRDEAEEEVARLASDGVATIFPITPDMVGEEEVVVQVIHACYAS